MSLATITELGALLHQNLDGDDATARLALSIATSAVQEEAETTFGHSQDDEVTLDGSGTDALLLPGLPVLDVSTVEVDSDTESPTELVADEDFWIDFDAGLLIRRGDLWPTRRRSVTVTYSHGYEVGEPAPALVKGIVLQVAARIYRNLGVKDESLGFGSYSASFAASGVELTEGERNALRRFRDVRIA